jgi:hypothetical protein
LRRVRSGDSSIEGNAVTAILRGSWRIEALLVRFEELDEWATGGQGRRCQLPTDCGMTLMTQPGPWINARLFIDLTDPTTSNQSY